MCVHICVCEKEREREKVEEKSLMKKGIKLLCSAIYSRARNDYQESRSTTAISSKHRNRPAKISMGPFPN